MQQRIESTIDETPPDLGLRPFRGHRRGSVLSPRCPQTGASQSGQSSEKMPTMHHSNEIEGMAFPSQRLYEDREMGQARSTDAWTVSEALNEDKSMPHNRKRGKMRTLPVSVPHRFQIRIFSPVRCELRSREGRWSKQFLSVKGALDFVARDEEAQITFTDATTRGVSWDKGGLKRLPRSSVLHVE
ncbi:MAG: hypothetical protein ABJF10_15685 [Chthoniobacter sp.]|uniref:hypothetical protein n=1 Tax=Chthoniobacter sp. TaxID=2510640 RepID=UPI0032AC0E94